MVTAINAPQRQLVPNGLPGQPDDPYPVPNPDGFDGDFQPAPDLERIAKALISANEVTFRPLQSLTVVYLWKAKGGQKSGKGTLGKCQKPSGLLRYFSEADFVIWLAADHWTGYGATRWQIEACVFHEMKHVGIETDEKTGTETPALVPHDFEAFADEVTHYGTYLYDLKKAQKAFEQLPLWDDAHEAGGRS